MTPTRSLAMVAMLSLAWASTARGALCQGDCNGDGRVEVHELLRGVAIALGSSPYRLCPPVDADGDQDVTVAELVGAINPALSECPETITVNRAPETAAPAGPLGNGQGILPNGRRVEPVGAQLALDTFPLNIAVVPGGRFLLLTNDGWGNEEGGRGLQLVDRQSGSVRRIEVPHTFGLAVAPAGDRVFVTDGDTNHVYSLHFEGDNLVRDADPLATLPAASYPSALAIAPDGSHLYVLGLNDNTFRSIDLANGQIHETDAKVGNFPYSILLTADGRRAFVSSWGVNNGNPPSQLIPPLPPTDPNVDARSSVAELDLSDPNAPHLVGYSPIARSLAVDAQRIFGGSHPSAMALSPDGRLLYVTASNFDLLVVLDAATRALIAEVPLNTFDATTPLREQLQGFYPNALAVRADGRRVYVADAGINAVQVIDVDPDARTFASAGFIPTGWFPSALSLDPDGTLYVANGKGAGIGPNGAELIDINDTNFGSTPYYIGRLVKGSLSTIADVDQQDLSAGATTVARLNGLTPVEVRWTDGAPGPTEVQRGNPVPIDFGSGPSEQIKHVVFILKENRTYDQIFGDDPRGNGDPRLALFGRSITPNHHKLAEEFAMGDNFFCDGEVSIPGHEWTDQATTTDFTEKLWPRNYNGKLSDFVIQYGQEGFGKHGYLFESLQRQGVSYRVYGETFHFLTRYVAGIDGGGAASIYPVILDAFNNNPGALLGGLADLLSGNIAALEASGANVDKLRHEVWPNIMLDYPANILANRTDVERANLFLSELSQFEADDNLPSFVFIWLPNDHTFGAAPNMPTPNSAVADNDAGLGMIVEGLSKSRFWDSMAIFVNEDDAQDAQDHVSAHRSLGLVISPYVKRGYISPVHHSNVSMLKTMELMLGMQPLTQYDRNVTDMRDYFVATPDYTVYEALPLAVAARLNPEPEDAPNHYLRRAAELSEDMNFEMYDEAGEDLPKVLWLTYSGEQLERRKHWAFATAAVIGGLSLLLLAARFIHQRAGLLRTRAT